MLRQSNNWRLFKIHTNNHNTKHQPTTKSLETRPNGVLQQNTKNKLLTNCINFMPAENTFY